MKKPSLLNRKYSNDFLALISGCFLTLAFAPFNLFPLAFLCPAILLYTWFDVSPLRAFFRGWLFGFGLFSTGVYWIFISIHTYGNANIFLSVLISILLFMVLAFFPAATGYFLNRYFPKTNTAKILFAFPVIWVFFEWVRSWIFSGFTWLTLGYSQLATPLRGYAVSLSVLGVSLSILITIGLCYEIFFEYKKHQRKKLIRHVLALIFLWGMGIFLSHYTWTQPSGQPIKVSLIQGNIPQEIKWSPDALEPTLDKYKQLTDAHLDSQLIIWPEGAIPLPMQYALDYIETMTDEVKAHNAAILTGIPVKADKGYYNAIIAFGSNVEGAYAKRRLVPFGEYTPNFKLFNYIMGSLDIPMADFVVGPSLHPPIKAFGTKIDSFICYEITFPEQVRNIDPGIGIILTINNDAWFGKSIASAQHFQMGQMRAVENGRPVIFVSNTGITGIIKPNGQIQSSAPPFEEYVLTDTVQPYTGLTPWGRLGMDPLLLILFWMLIKAILLKKRIN